MRSHPTVPAVDIDDIVHRLAADPLDVGPFVLGSHLTVRDEAGQVTIQITEVEAYRGADDPGSHARSGDPTKRTQPMFRSAGHMYCYLSYGMHICANLVTGEEGTASALLLRGGAITEGLNLAQERRTGGTRTIKDGDLAKGPANLAKALGLTLSDSGAFLRTGGRIELQLAQERAVFQTGPRVGVSGPGGAGDTYPWRMWIPGAEGVSTYRPAKPRRRSDRH